MAMQQTVETVAGASVSYWMILREEIDHLAGTRSVTVAGFVSEAKRRAGRAAVIPLSFIFTAADFADCPDISAVPRTELYTAVRAAAERQAAATGTTAEADGAATPDSRAWIAALATAQNC